MSISGRRKRVRRYGRRSFVLQLCVALGMLFALGSLETAAHVAIGAAVGAVLGLVLCMTVPGLRHGDA